MNISEINTIKISNGYSGYNYRYIKVKSCVCIPIQPLHLIIEANKSCIGSSFKFEKEKTNKKMEHLRNIIH